MVKIAHKPDTLEDMVVIPAGEFPWGNDEPGKRKVGLMMYPLDCGQVRAIKGGYKI